MQINLTLATMPRSHRHLTKLLCSLIFISSGIQLISLINALFQLMVDGLLLRNGQNVPVLAEPKQEPEPVLTLLLLSMELIVSGKEPKLETAILSTPV